MIIISLSGVSTNGSSNIIVQIGDSGGIETTGYLGSCCQINDAAATAAANLTTGFGITGAMAASLVLHGSMILTLEDSSDNTWAAVSSMGQSNAAASQHGGGVKATSAVLDRVSLTTVSALNSFDAGVINIAYF